MFFFSNAVVFKNIHEVTQIELISITEVDSVLQIYYIL